MQGQDSFRTIGKYQILGPVGRGSMGLVYKARDPEIGRLVAIKTLRKLISSDPAEVEAAIRRFKFEARSAGNLRHPNIITIFEVNHDGDTPYIVMDYVEGEALDAVIERQGKLSLEQTTQYLMQVAQGLDYAHGRGVVHRDIKPSNILVDKSGNVFILDFGIASINESFPDADLTATNSQIMGTPGYMSPEQILNDKLDGRTDLFSLAIVAFECIAGQRPFPGDNFTTVIGNILNSKPLSLTALLPELPLALEAEFERGLAKKKEDRFESAEKLITALAQSVGLGIKGSSVVTSPTRTRKISSWKSLKQSVGLETQEKLSKESVVKTANGTDLLRTESQRSFEKKTQDNDAPFSGRISQQGGKTPGSMFSEQVVQPSKKPKKYCATSRTPLQALSISVALGCLLLASITLWYAYSANSFSHTANSASQPDLVTAQNQIGDLVELQVEIPNVNKSVLEMSDRELLGILLKGAGSEAKIIEALREAKSRKLPSLVDASVGPLQNDSFIVRIEIIKLLGEMGDRRIVPQLMLSLDDHDPLVRKAAAAALGKLGDRRALGYLNARLFKEDLAEVKNEIKLAVQSINGYP